MSCLSISRLQVPILHSFKFMRAILVTLVLLIIPHAWAAPSNQLQVQYFDESGNSIDTDWDARYFPIITNVAERSQLSVQIWLALPPLMDLVLTDGSGVILENTKENKSPFYKKDNIKRVLRLETKKRTNVVSFNNNKVRIKLNIPEHVSYERTTKECHHNGFQLNQQWDDHRPFLLLLDCKNLDQWSLHISSSPDVQLSKAKQTAKPEQNGTLDTEITQSVSLPKDYDEKPIEIFSFFVAKSDQKKGRSISYKSKNKVKKFKYKTKNSSESKHEQVNVEVTPDTSEPLFLYRLGALVSKLGLEANFDFYVKPVTTPGYFRLSGLLPAQQLNIKRKSDVYFTSQLQFLYPMGILHLGGGLSSVHLRQPIAKGAGFDYFGPNLIAILPDAINLNRNHPVSFEALFSSIFPIGSDKDSTGHRLFLEARSTLLESQYGVWEVSLAFSSLDINNRLLRYSDNKFLGGILYKW